MKFSKNLYQQVETNASLKIFSEEIFKGMARTVDLMSSDAYFLFQEDWKLKTENKEGFLIYLKKGFFTFFFGNSIKHMLI